MGHVDSKPHIIVINSKDLEENKISLSDLNEKSKTNLLSLNIKNSFVSKKKIQKKRKVNFENIELFIELEDLEVGKKYFEKDYMKYQDFYNREIERLNIIFHPKFEGNQEDEFNMIESSIEQKRDNIERYFLKNFELANKHDSVFKLVEKGKIGTDKLNKALILKPTKIAELANPAEIEKIKKDFEKETLDVKNPEFVKNMNLLILKYENVRLNFIFNINRNHLSFANNFS